jgi:hypothetical protein
MDLTYLIKRVELKLIYIVLYPCLNMRHLRLIIFYETYKLDKITTQNQ